MLSGESPTFWGDCSNARAISNLIYFLAENATERMEERTVPAGLGAFAHRGPTHLVRLLPGSKLLEIVNDFLFIPDPPDATTFCVSHDMVEGVFTAGFSPPTPRLRQLIFNSV